MHTAHTETKLADLEEAEACRQEERPRHWWEGGEGGPGCSALGGRGAAWEGAGRRQTAGEDGPSATAGSGRPASALRTAKT